MAFVLAKDVTHVKVLGGIRLFQVSDNKIKLLTNAPLLATLEELIGFDFKEALETIADTCGEVRDGEVFLPNGFYIINHHTRSSDFFPADDWSAEVEAHLKAKGCTD